MSESQDDASIEEVTIDEAIFLYHIDQLKRAEREDICRIATVLLEAHRIIRHKFRQLQVRDKVHVLQVSDDVHVLQVSDNVLVLQVSDDVLVLPLRFLFPGEK